jgi:CubicO group peptidase (beta-lactamase class C family)
MSQRAFLAHGVAVLFVLFGVAATAEDKAGAIDALLARYQEIGAFNGSALVAEHGVVVFKKGFGQADFEWRVPNAPDTKFRVGSITKQFTAALVLQLVQEGKLSLDTTLGGALPYYRKDVGARVTIRHLLNHTSGIPSYTNRPDFGREVSRDPYGVREFVEKFCSGDLEFEPGSTFRYNNSGYFLLGAILEQATGTPYERLLQERVFSRLGMTSTGYDRSAPILERRARGYERSLDGVRNADYLDMSLPYAAGSLYSTVEDLYRWDQALYSDAVLPEAARTTMFTPGLENYGFGWGIRKQPIGPSRAERTTISHGGGINGFNTLIMRVPEERHLVVLLNNTGGTALDAMSAGILDILYGRTPTPPKQPVAKLLYDTLRKDGIKAAVAQYHDVKKTRPAEFDWSEPQLNRLGYELLRGERTAEAVEIFKLNVEMFPASGNVYDSLAEAYMTAGDKTLAVKNYAKSLELDPTNRNAVEKLAELLK